MAGASRWFYLILLTDLLVRVIAQSCLLFRRAATPKIRPSAFAELLSHRAEGLFSFRKRCIALYRYTRYVTDRRPDLSGRQESSSRALLRAVHSNSAGSDDPSAVAVVHSRRERPPSDTLEPHRICLADHPPSTSPLAHHAPRPKYRCRFSNQNI